MTLGTVELVWVHQTKIFKYNAEGMLNKLCTLSHKN
jgi:hypothetical protein